MYSARLPERNPYVGRMEIEVLEPSIGIEILRHAHRAGLEFNLVEAMCACTVVDPYVTMQEVQVAIDALITLKLLIKTPPKSERAKDHVLGIRRRQIAAARKGARVA